MSKKTTQTRQTSHKKTTHRSPSAVQLLNEILDATVANRGHGKHAFYICSSYPHGKFPAWVRKAERWLKANTEKETKNE